MPDVGARHPPGHPVPPYPPIEPPATHVVFPDPRELEEDVVAVGTDFSPGTLLEAYREGIFPWPHGRVVAWFSPDPRAVLPLEAPLHWSRSLRRTLRHHPYEVTVDAAFAEVMRTCGSERSEGTWITPGMLAGYTRLHELGWTHSVEVWEHPEGGGPRELVGGIYGVAVGALFAGESMFHRRTDCSKIAFATLAERLVAGGFELFDVQMLTSHLESLGCVEIPRDEYLDRVARAIAKPARL
jgi:leucyl/phenylalanyl-tRNA--protein transferase